MAEVYLTCNRDVAYLPGVRRAVKDVADDTGREAEGILEQIRATTPHHKIFGPGGLVRIGVTPDPERRTDWFVHLYAPNPIAVEYGHQPSGVFEGTATKPPEGLYILHRAARLI